MNKSVEDLYGDKSWVDAKVFLRECKRAKVADLGLAKTMAVYIEKGSNIGCEWESRFPTESRGGHVRPVVKTEGERSLWTCQPQ